MSRTIIRIDESLCDGCGLCVTACHEGAIALVDGKARLVSETYCDGLGACLGECPRGAIALETREAAEFLGPAPGSPAARPTGADPGAAGHAAPAAPPFADPLPAAAGTGPAPSGGTAREAFARALAQAPAAPAAPSGHGCPGSALRDLRGPAAGEGPSAPARAPGATAPAAGPGDPPPSLLGHWPVQLMLVPPGAPFLQGAPLLVCADCVPFAVRDFHDRYLDGQAVVVGCPKLDDLGHYRRKLAEILAAARPASLRVLRMEVPCCGGIVGALVEARDAVMPGTPVECHTVGIRGGAPRVQVY